jgi:hypothetical protein
MAFNLQPFTLEVYFTGLGVGLIREDTSKQGHGHVLGVDLLLIDTAKAMAMAAGNPPMNMPAAMPGMPNMPNIPQAPNAPAPPNAPAAMAQHIPRLFFEVEDLARTDAPDVEVPGVSTVGMPLVRLDLKDKDIQINVTDAPAGAGNGHGNGKVRANGNRFLVTEAPKGASAPNRLSGKQKAPEDAINWVPDLAADLGISNPILLKPGDPLAGSPYTSRVTLPAGKVSSQRLFFDRMGNHAEVQYGNAAGFRVLADQFLWTRTEVLSVAIAGHDHVFEFDATLREMRHEPRPTVRITVSCLPETLDNPNRFRFPAHFPMFELINRAGTAPNQVTTKGLQPVCAGIACPPGVTVVAPGKG